eukprot:scaffold33055_cov55-Phaeocystis_antarctica.AAC.8
MHVVVEPPAGAHIAHCAVPLAISQGLLPAEIIIGREVLVQPRRAAVAVPTLAVAGLWHSVRVPCSEHAADSLEGEELCRRARLRCVVFDEVDDRGHEGVVDVRVDQSAVDHALYALMEGDHARVHRSSLLRRDVTRAVAATVADLKVALLEVAGEVERLGGRRGDIEEESLRRGAQLARPREGEQPHLGSICAQADVGSRGSAVSGGRGVTPAPRGRDERDHAVVGGEHRVLPLAALAAQLQEGARLRAAEPHAVVARAHLPPPRERSCRHAFDAHPDHVSSVLPGEGQLQLDVVHRHRHAPCA